MPAADWRTDGDWLAKTIESLRFEGFALVTGALDLPMLEQTRSAMYRVQERIRRDLGDERLKLAGELGVLRLMMKYDDFFFRYLELAPLLEIVDATVSPTAILHLQNGFILPSFPPGQRPDVFQGRFHPDFRRVLGGYRASVNLMFAIDSFTADNGATLAVPGTHNADPPPTEQFMRSRAIAVECPAGSILVFDSTLWHAAGANTSGKDRLAINHQFTRSWIKQQFDYVRALGDAAVLAQPPRTQQLLGWYTRVVTSLDEYYRPPNERLYRAGQD
jgi:ectoine hydroxylase-related dioxygenase (phytanoyl-CoA dioxygenase family)